MGSQDESGFTSTVEILHVDLHLSPARTIQSVSLVVPFQTIPPDVGDNIPGIEPEKRVEDT